MSPTELAAIAARAEAATPGPWVFERADLLTEGMADTTYQHIRSGPVGVADTYHCQPIAIEGFGRMSGYIPPRHGKVADAAFIAHAREDVPSLLAALDEASREIDRLKALLKVSP